MNHNIILTGFMGSGKTTIGRKLSAHLHRPLIDTDHWIEENQNRTISEIFAAEGEPCFRQLETQCLKVLFTDKEEKIISTGGGILMKEENRLILKELGKVIYLKVSAGEVRRRLAGDETRPLLSSVDSFRKAEILLHSRVPIYELTADIIINTDNKDFKEILQEILFYQM